MKTRRRALVFTHGYNTQFDEAVVRLAQIVDDTHYPGLPVLFSWPSRGEVRDYGYDKDSANFSRDAMADLLARLARDPGIEGIDIFAHSMGNWLTMETLRQLSIAGDAKTLGRLGTIVMAAPDIDMDVFRTQIARLRPLAARIVLYASRDDYALDLSRRLFGGKIRPAPTPISASSARWASRRTTSPRSRAGSAATTTRPSATAPPSPRSGARSPGGGGDPGWRLDPQRALRDAGPLRDAARRRPHSRPTFGSFAMTVPSPIGRLAMPALLTLAALLAGCNDKPAASAPPPPRSASPRRSRGR